jgi:hypothetical protein
VRLKAGGGEWREEDEKAKELTWIHGGVLKVSKKNTLLL